MADHYEHTAAYYNDTDRNRDYKEPLFRAAGQLVPVHCELCGCLTDNTGTKLCDRCYALKVRVEADPELTQAILDALNHKGE